MKRHAATATLLIGLLAAVSPTGDAREADKFPVKPVTALVGFPPGGSTDLIARALESVMKSQLGQPLVVVNRTGGVGTIAVSELVKAKPDGYT
ncbi:MAG: tripartite tricarboxylate transporter substrate-binding protein, partial [Candidatus Rokuibacteriota bacterium]